MNSLTELYMPCADESGAVLHLHLQHEWCLEMLLPPRCAAILLTYRCRQVWEPPAETYGSKQIDTQDCDLSFRLVANLSAFIVAKQPITA